MERTLNHPISNKILAKDKSTADNMLMRLTSYFNCIICVNHAISRCKIPEKDRRKAIEGKNLYNIKDLMKIKIAKVELGQS